MEDHCLRLLLEQRGGIWGMSKAEDPPISCPLSSQLQQRPLVVRDELYSEAGQ